MDNEVCVVGLERTSTTKETTKRKPKKNKLDIGCQHPNQSLTTTRRGIGEKRREGEGRGERVREGAGDGEERESGRKRERESRGRREGRLWKDIGRDKMSVVKHQ